MRKLISQEYIQTQTITAYSFPAIEDSPLPYKLTVVDTPGFRDTRGLERDEEIIAQIKRFFSLNASEGIDHMDGIGFVVQPSLARLTYTQKYIIDIILSVFGKDVVNNIFWTTIFADGQFPPVMDAIKTYVEGTNPPIPLGLESFKYNNSSLSTKPQISDISFEEMFWQLGYQSFHKLFDHLGEAIPQSLTLTKAVLEEHMKLQMLIQNVQKQTCMGMNYIDELHQEKRILEDYDAKIRANMDFTYEVKEYHTKKEMLPENTFILNCIRCNRTCLDPCTIPRSRHKDIRVCSAMDFYGYCSLSWSLLLGSSCIE